MLPLLIYSSFEDIIIGTPFVPVFVGFDKLSLDVP
jgi:hypothetical protein